MTRVASIALPVLLLLAAGPLWAEPTIRVVTLPGGSGSARSNSLAAERRIAITGTRLLELRRVVPAGFVEQLRAAYDHLEHQVGQVRTALVASQLDLQHPRAFDTVVVAPRGARHDAAVVFLHGHAGNVGLICWLFARAVVGQGLTTYCPSVGYRGDWWSERGARTVSATLDHLRRLGVRRVYLAGLSNGATGASLLASRFRRRIAGLVLLSGLSRRARPPRVDVLLIHGRSDPAVPARTARSYLRRAGRRATHVTLPGAHFVMLTRQHRVTAAISRWFERRRGSRPARRGTASSR